MSTSLKNVGGEIIMSKFITVTLAIISPRKLNPLKFSGKFIIPINKIQFIAQYYDAFGEYGDYNYSAIKLDDNTVIKVKETTDEIYKLIEACS